MRNKSSTEYKFPSTVTFHKLLSLKYLSCFRGSGKESAFARNFATVCVKEACPVDQKYQTSSLIYQATVTRHDSNKDGSYIGRTNKHIQDAM